MSWESNKLKEQTHLDVGQTVSWAPADNAQEMIIISTLIREKRVHVECQALWYVLQVCAPFIHRKPSEVVLAPFLLIGN